MKTTLFWVFVGIFVATAVATLGAMFHMPGFTNVSQTTEKTMRIALILEVVVVIMGLARLLFFGSTDFIKFVKKDEPGIWEDFVGSYAAFNAPWLLEFTSGGKLTSTYVPIHQRRMANTALTSVDYVYFADGAFAGDGQSESWRRFERFVRFEAMVFYGLSQTQVEGPSFADLMKEKIKGDQPETLSKLGAYLCEGEMPSMTFFCGYKSPGKKGKKHDPKKEPAKNIRECLWYVASEPFYNRGNPENIFHIREGGFWSDLYKVFQNAIRTETRLCGPAVFQKYVDVIRERSQPGKRAGDSSTSTKN
jgi:hypothetical protein